MHIFFNLDCTRAEGIYFRQNVFPWWVQDSNLGVSGTNPLSHKILFIANFTIYPITHDVYIYNVNMYYM